MAINKVIYGSDTLIDLENDTVSSDKLLSGYTAHDKSGTLIEGGIPTYKDVNLYEYSSRDGEMYGVPVKGIFPPSGYYEMMDGVIGITLNAMMDVVMNAGKVTIDSKGIHLDLSNVFAVLQNMRPVILADSFTVDIPIEIQTFRTGTSDPNNGLGDDGDIYFVTEG